MKNKKLIATSLLTAFASSLYCIVPLLALISGTTGIASNFSWLTPIRPYLMVFTILVLSFAWYQKLKPKKEIECVCQTKEKSSFFQSKLFLGLITVFALYMTFLPFYSTIFYPKSKQKIVVVNNKNKQSVNIKIKGMTCTACEEHITHSVSKIEGVLSVKPSYNKKNAVIEFDNSKTTIKDIKKAINNSGYNVINKNENEN